MSQKNERLFRKIGRDLKVNPSLVKRSWNKLSQEKRAAYRKAHKSSEKNELIQDEQ